MLRVHKPTVRNPGEFLWASADSGNAWERVKKTSRDKVQDYARGNDNSNIDLFYDANRWSLAARYDMLGWAPIASREQQQLYRWVWNLS